MNSIELSESRTDPARLAALTRLFDPHKNDFGPVGQQMASLVLEAAEILLGGRGVRSPAQLARVTIDLEQFRPFVSAPELRGRSSDRARAFVRRPLRLTRPDAPLPEIGLLVADATRPLTVWERGKRWIGWPGSRRPYGSPGVSIRLDCAAHLAWFDRRFQIDLLSHLDDFVKANVLLRRNVPRPTLPRDSTLWALAAFALVERHRPGGRGRRARRCRALTDSLVQLLLHRVTGNGDDGSYDLLLLCEIWLRSQAWPDGLRGELERHEALAALRDKFAGDGNGTDRASSANAQASDREDETENVGADADSAGADSAAAPRPPVSVTRAQLLEVAAEPPLAWPIAVRHLLGALAPTHGDVG